MSPTRTLAPKPASGKRKRQPDRPHGSGCPHLTLRSRGSVNRIAARGMQSAQRSLRPRFRGSPRESLTRDEAPDRNLDHQPVAVLRTSSEWHGRALGRHSMRPNRIHEGTNLLWSVIEFAAVRITKAMATSFHSTGASRPAGRAGPVRARAGGNCGGGPL